MRPAPSRLGTEPKHHLTGRDLDRSRPLRFRLNGTTIQGFEGDTVLSAALASGLDTAGQRGGEPLALDERFSPPVALRNFARDPHRAMPMDRMPAIGGLDLVSVGQREHTTTGGFSGRLRRMFGGPTRSLGLRLDDIAALAGPWADAPPARTIDADVVVIGAGLAGLSAALYAARAGDRVVLIERTQSAGGAVRLFGAVEGEDSPDTTIAKMIAELAQAANVTQLYRAEAYAILDTTVRVHHVHGEIGEVIDIKARFVVVATGSLERLPVFPGNRLPGVVGSLAAFHRADRYGVWSGKRAVFCTSASEAYRLAVMAHDAGIAIQKLADTRLQPQSRFIEFSKAYGIQLTNAMMPRAATRPSVPGARGITAVLGPTFDDLEQAPLSLDTDMFVVAGGWQPDLSLWHVAGGESRWRSETSRLEAVGEVPGIALAGSAAGYFSNRGCLQSGAAAVSRLTLGFVPEIDDPRFEAIHESYDDPTTVAAADDSYRGQSYLDFGTTLTMRPAAPPRRRLPGWMGSRQRWQLADQSRALSVSDVAAGVQLNAIAVADAGIVAQERCVIAGDLIATGKPAVAILPAAPAPRVPLYLAGRFGADAALWVVEALDGRGFEVGLLAYPNSDRSNPAGAIGVVLGQIPQGKNRSLLLVAASSATAGGKLFIKDTTQPVPARLIEPFSEAAPAEAAVAS